MLAPGATLLEGTLEGYSSIAVSMWPNKKAAEDFWYSDEYKEVKKLREGLADVEVILVETPDLISTIKPADGLNWAESGLNQRVL